MDILEKSCENCYYKDKEPHWGPHCKQCAMSNVDFLMWEPKIMSAAELHKEKIDVVNDIGVPATLELCAEEAVELAHAALKMARKLRGENPTPKSMDDIIECLTEELGDVQINIDKILEYGIVPKADVDAVKEFKRKRWEERLREKKKLLEGSK